MTAPRESLMAAAGAMVARFGVAVALLPLLGGCPRGDHQHGSNGHGSSRGASSTTPTAAPPTATAPTAASAPPADASGWVGNWRSPPCGQRRYTRDLELKPKGVAAVRDLVSPCPPNVACVWSGVISYEGTWTLEGERVELKLERKTYPNMKAAPLPTELSWSAGPVAEEAGVRCTYRSQ